MPERNYYLITSLPPLISLGQAPPMSLAELRDQIAASPTAGRLADVIFLGDDLFQRQAVLAGELDSPEPVVLTLEQLRDEQPLPEYLATAQTDRAGALAVDVVMAAYFRHARRTAEQLHSRFLEAWVGFEVALRNALVQARAKALGLDAAEYFVTPHLAHSDEDLEGLVAEWSSAPDPLTGQRRLDTARWNWIERHDAWYTFGDDELGAYATKLMLLHRWQRLTKASHDEEPVAHDRTT